MYSCFLHIFVLYSHQQCCDGHTSLLHSPAVTPVTPSPARCRSTAPHCSTGSRAARSPQQSGDMSSGRLRSEVTLHNATGTSLSLRIWCAFNVTSLTSSVFCKTLNYAGTFLEAHCFDPLFGVDRVFWNFFVGFLKSGFILFDFPVLCDVAPIKQ